MKVQNTVTHKKQLTLEETYTEVLRQMDLFIDHLRDQMINCTEHSISAISRALGCNTQRLEQYKRNNTPISCADGAANDIVIDAFNTTALSSWLYPGPVPEAKECPLNSYKRTVYLIAWKIYLTEDQGQRMKQFASIINHLCHCADGSAIVCKPAPNLHVN